MINSNKFTIVSYGTTLGGGVGLFAGSFILAKMSRKDVKDGGCLLLPLATAVGASVGFALGCTLAFLDAVLTNESDATSQMHPN